MRLNIICTYLIIMLLIINNLCIGQVLNSSQRSHIDIEKRDQFEAHYADWGEYNNRIYRFKLRFPSECLYISESGPMSNQEKINRRNRGTIFYGQEVCIYSIIFGDRISPVFSISIYNNPDSLKLEEFAIKIMQLGKLYNINEIQTQHTMICDKIAVRTIYENKVGGYTGIVTPTFVKMDKYIIGVRIISPISYMAYEAFYDKVINSLRLY